MGAHVVGIVAAIAVWCEVVRGRPSAGRRYSGQYAWYSRLVEKKGEDEEEKKRRRRETKAG